MAEPGPELTRAEQIALLRSVIAASGLSNRKFAEDAIARDERTVRRWLSGKAVIPAAVIRWLHTQPRAK